MYEMQWSVYYNYLGCFWPQTSQNPIQSYINNKQGIPPPLLAILGFELRTYVF
jgi:hypothetical protein